MGSGLLDERAGIASVAPFRKRGIRLAATRRGARFGATRAPKRAPLIRPQPRARSPGEVTSRVLEPTPERSRKSGIPPSGPNQPQVVGGGRIDCATVGVGRLPPRHAIEAERRRGE